MSAQKTFSLTSLLMRTLLTLWPLLTAGAGHAIERVTYYHNDALGSPVAATDKNGMLLWRETYAPYGERLTREARRWDTLWYIGKQEEAAFGINYFGARWYDPSIGRFMGVDPAGFNAENIQSFNKYAYANNNPYVYVDPDGRWPLDNLKARVKDRFKTTYDMHKEQHPLAHEEIFGDVENSAKPLYRNMSKAEAESVKKTGKLRGGNEGDTYFTDSRFRSADTAQDRLSLPNRPEVQMEFRMKNNPSMTRNGTKVEPEYGGRGGGREYMTTDPVEVEIVNVQPYR